MAFRSARALACRVGSQADACSVARCRDHGTQELSLRRCRIEQGVTFGFTARYSAKEPDRS